jgi:hypothetical protein
MAEKKPEQPEKPEQTAEELGPSKLDELPHDAVKTEDGYIYPDSGSCVYTFENTGKEETDTKAEQHKTEEKQKTPEPAVTAPKATPVRDEPRRRHR